MKKTNITKTKKIFLAGCLFFASALAVLSIAASKADAAAMSMPNAMMGMYGMGAGYGTDAYGMNMYGMDMSGMNLATVPSASWNQMMAASMSNMSGMGNMNGMSGMMSNVGTNATGRAATPNNASWNQMTGGWQCNYGYTLNRSTGACEPIAMPENAGLNRYGTGWECNDGYLPNRNTNSCDPIPAYATANQAKTGWFCNWGYKLNSERNGCNPISIPENAVLDYWGMSWQCKSGYTYSYLTGICEENPVYHY